MAEDPSYFKHKINLFIALAPSILFKYSTEPYYKAWATETAIAELAMQFRYMEYNGEPINNS